MKWDNRSRASELLDLPGVPFEAIRQNLIELKTINHLLGGHRLNIQAVAALVKSRPGFSICEIGSGGGDNLASIRSWATSNGKSITTTGIDLNGECIRYARENDPGTRYLHSDYRQVTFSEKPDIIFSSLFCHHFSDDELVAQLKWMKEYCNIGFFINDLHRHPVAYYSIKWITALLSRSVLVKNDAPLSVLRGFRREEWVRLLRKAGIDDYQIRWAWAFRWSILAEVNQQ
ncbi:methyltransferase domain-containing protein [Flavihumibacter petaseus]|uniref:Methyltransferase domain-containing protein n=1 Tax=Flavihumibacter petaseus NBRC 106054 TaxID=1220578 RepID=A0A0E9N5A8_9BACT|nr:methyltransferase domain-containing protein [Flavihumibacter petaseus]GAO44988.1 hypothetical protein FPE01S_04_02310 [Flavihumibacter petaseus NBRC 106054]